MQRVHWDPEFARARGQPDHLRLRAHARDVAHPPLHRLDGRRRVAVEARLRVPAVQLRRRHALAARAGSTRKLPRRRRPAGGRRSSCRAENQRGEVTTPGHATILLPSREHGAGAPARPARRRDARPKPRYAPSSTASRRWRGRNQRDQRATTRRSACVPDRHDGGDATNVTSEQRPGEAHAYPTGMMEGTQPT